MAVEIYFLISNDFALVYQLVNIFCDMLITINFVIFSDYLLTFTVYLLI